MANVDVFGAHARGTRVQRSPIEDYLIGSMEASGFRLVAEGVWEFQDARQTVRAHNQFRIEVDGLAYVVDFAFFVAGVQVAVECDGHAYHATKEAVARDRSRDRALARAGWPVLRFTGAELYANATACLDEIRLTTLGESGRHNDLRASQPARLRFGHDEGGR